MEKKFRKPIIWLIILGITGITTAIIYFFSRKKTGTGLFNTTGILGISQEPPPKLSFPPDTVKAFDDFFDSNAAEHNNQVVVCVSTATMEYRYQKGNLSYNDPSSIGNLSRQLVAATVMTLVDEGKIDLDETLGRYLPWLKDVPVYSTYTVRNVLSQQTSIVDAVEYNLDNTISLDQATRSIVDKYPISTVNLPYYQYSNSNSTCKFAARVAEVVSGKTWETLFKERIAQKCDMKNTYFSSGTTNPNVGNGAQSSVNDYSHFIDMLRNYGVYGGKRVLSIAAIKEMETIAGTIAGADAAGLGSILARDGSQVVAEAGNDSYTTSWIYRNNDSCGIILTSSKYVSWQFRMLVLDKHPGIKV